MKGLFGVTSCLRRASLVFYIANDCLSAAIHMDVFDADVLVAPMTQASENLYLRRIPFSLIEPRLIRRRQFVAPLRVRCPVWKGSTWRPYGCRPSGWRARRRFRP
jgi:hypothetical protein